MTRIDAAELRTGLFRDPLADWPNDDLLISDVSRRTLQRTHPELLRVLDWPDLREAFLRHEGPARRNRRASHYQGLFAITFAGLGVVLLGVAPALSNTAATILATIALLCMSIGGSLGVLHWVVLRSRFAWLGHRFWTERLRQLYFQSLVNALDLTAAAMTDDASLATLRKQRLIWLTEFYTYPADPRDRIRAIVNDRTETNTWIRHEWKQFRRPECSAEALRPLLEGLYRQRIHIQASYSEKNLGSDVFSPLTRAKILHTIGDSSTILVVGVALLGWLAHMLGSPVLGVNALIWTSVAAVLSAAGLVARATDQGLQNEADAERYEWYADAVSEVEERYEMADASHRVWEMRCIEEVAYKELRRFMRTHNTARFMM